MAFGLLAVVGCDLAEDGVDLADHLLRLVVARAARRSGPRAPRPRPGRRAARARGPARPGILRDRRGEPVRSIVGRPSSRCSSASARCRAPARPGRSAGARPPCSGDPRSARARRAPGMRSAARRRRSPARRRAWPSPSTRVRGCTGRDSLGPWRAHRLRPPRPGRTRSGRTGRRPGGTRSESSRRCRLARWNTLRQRSRIAVDGSSSPVSA